LAKIQSNEFGLMATNVSGFVLETKSNCSTAYKKKQKWVSFCKEKKNMSNIHRCAS